VSVATDEVVYIAEDPFRIVEGPGGGQLQVYAHGTAVAILDGLLQARECLQEMPWFYGNVYDFRSLLWSHGSALRRLGGEPIQQILGLAAVYLAGTPRPDWAERPGIDGVRVVVPLENSGGLGVAQVFALAKNSGF
jgi:hypothetical protein